MMISGEDLFSPGDFGFVFFPAKGVWESEPDAPASSASHEDVVNAFMGALRSVPGVTLVRRAV